MDHIPRHSLSSSSCSPSPRGGPGTFERGALGTAGGFWFFFGVFFEFFCWLFLFFLFF